MTIKVFNLATDESLHFDDDVGHEWAVAYAFCGENNLMSALFNHRERGSFPEFFKVLPVTRGKYNLACGDWVTATEDV